MSVQNIEVAGHSITVEDSQAWWGNNLPTEQRGDGLVLITQESVIRALSEKLDLPEEVISAHGTSVFFDTVALIQTMLEKEQAGELSYVLPQYGDGQNELSAGYQLIKNGGR